MKAILTAVCLLTAFSVFAETTEARCVAARDAATKLLAAGSTEAEHTAKWRAAEKHAFTVCTSANVPAEVRTAAIVRWAGTLNDTPAELGLLKKALRETEATAGADSQALLPLIDRLSSLYGIQPSKRRDALELAQRGLRIREQAFGETSAEAAEGLTLLGLLWFTEEMPDRNLALAEQYLREAVAVADKVCGPACPALFSALSNLHSVVKVQPGRETEAAKIESELQLVYNAMHSRAAK